MDPRLHLLTALQHCLPFLANKNFDFSIRWRVRLGRLSAGAKEIFPASECADQRRWIDDADEEAAAAEERFWDDLAYDARLGAQMFAECVQDCADGNE